eukprot:scaffold604_cov384-Prasinococcus_capsulatus_cf.AAC.40
MQIANAGGVSPWTLPNKVCVGQLEEMWSSEQSDPTPAAVNNARGGQLASKDWDYMPVTPERHVMYDSTNTRT